MRSDATSCPFCALALVARPLREDDAPTRARKSRAMILALSVAAGCTKEPPPVAVPVSEQPEPREAAPAPIETTPPPPADPPDPAFADGGGGVIETGPMYVPAPAYGGPSPRTIPPPTPSGKVVPPAAAYGAPPPPGL